MTLADRVVVLDRGRIAQVGTPLDLYHRPEDRFVASFIGSSAMNFLPATVIGAEGRDATVSVTGGRPVAARLRTPLAASPEGLELGIRPEHVAPTAAGAARSALDGRIGMVEHLGHTTMLYVDTLPATLWSRTGATPPVAPATPSASPSPPAPSICSTARGAPSDDPGRLSRPARAAS